MRSLRIIILALMAVSINVGACKTYESGINIESGELFYPGDGIIVVSGKIYNAVSCSIDIYYVDDGDNLVHLESIENGFYKDYKVRLTGGYDYRIVFNNGELTKHLMIENIKPDRKWYGLKRTTVVIDVDFSNNRSAKVRQVGEYFKFNTRL